MTPCIRTVLLGLTLSCPTVSAALAGGLDSGGGVATTANFRNHGSLGASIAPIVTASESVRVRTGLIEVLYPATADPTADADRNGLPDGWEREHFGSIGVNPARDIDGDGTSEELEFLAGTNPQDPNSVFRPEAIHGTDGPILRFQSVTSREYRIRESQDLVEWTTLETLPGTGEALQTTLSPDAETGRIFVRIEILIPQNL